MNTNNKTLLASGSVLALSIMMVAGLSFASAYGGDGEGGMGFGPRNADNHIEAKAELFNMTPEVLKERLDSGENFRDVAESLGISEEEMKAAMKESATEHVEQLRADGVITDERAEEMLERIESGEKPRGGKGGFHRGFHKGFGGCEDEGAATN